MKFFSKISIVIVIATLLMLISSCKVIILFGGETEGESQAIYPYWIEHDENGKPINYLWVKVPKIPAKGNKVIYIKKESGFAPNGNDVFEFFDDFDGNKLDTDKWEHYIYSAETVKGTVELCCSIVSVYTMTRSSNVFYKIKKEFTAPFAVKEYVESQNGNDGQYIIVTDTSKNIKFALGWAFPGYYSGTGAVYDDDNGRHGLSTFPLNSNEFFKIEYAFNGDSVYCSNKYEEFSGKVSIPSTPIYIAIGDGYGDYGPGYVKRDWIFVRKYADQKLAVSVQNKGNYYEVTINNPNTYDLKDYQVAIPLSKLDITSSTESLKVTDGNP